jgi:hypothetical protein
MPGRWAVVVTSGQPPDSATVEGREAAAGTRTRRGSALPLAVPGARPARRSPFFLGVALVGLAVGAAACGSGSVAYAPERGFYSSPIPIHDVPGTLLRYQSLGSAVAGTHAYRILYVSAASDGDPRASGGVVVLPDATPPAAGRPTVAWAHPVIGDNTAPSRSSEPLSTMDPWLTSAVTHGWIVVATDFTAVGTHQQETFIGRAEVNDIAYSVLAVRHLPHADPGAAWVAFGESSGGHGALWSGSLALTLTPRMQLLGVAAVAPVAELVPVEHAEGKPWAPALLAQTPVPPEPSIPAFVAQGTRDSVVPSSTTALLQHQWCSAGSTLYVDWLGGVTHRGAINASVPAALSWMNDRFRGTAAPNNCSSGSPVEPSPG